MDSLLTYITVELDKFDLNADRISNDLEKLIFTMKNLQTYADRPMAEFPEFWTEEWLKIAIEELDTRRFSAEQYEQYAITLARNASAVQMDQVKVAKVRAEERVKADAEKVQMILGMSKAGLPAHQIAIIAQKTEAEIQEIIAKQEI